MNFCEFKVEHIPKCTPETPKQTVLAGIVISAGMSHDITEPDELRAELESLRQENALLKGSAEEIRTLEQVLIDDQENMRTYIKVAHQLLIKACESRYQPGYRVDEYRSVTVAIELLAFALLTAEDRELNSAYYSDSSSAELEYSPELQEMHWVLDVIDFACKRRREFIS